MKPARWTVGFGFVLLALACDQAADPVQPEIGPEFNVVQDPGTVILCKGTPTPTAQTFDFTVKSTVGRVPGNGRFTLSTLSPDFPQCEVVWQTRNDGAGTVTITEEPTLGWELYRIKVSDIGDAPVESGSVTVDVDPTTTVVVTFKNAEADVDMAPGRMTGGGGQFTLNDVHVTRGFTIHCDLALSNNVEVNWPDGNQWHIDKPLTSAVCIDDPNVEPAPPPAPFDTFIGEGIGRLNGVDGSFIRFTFVDSGEPGGKSDLATILIWAPGADPDVDDPVLSVDGFLDHGNIQAHYDQPHK